MKVFCRSNRSVCGLFAALCFLSFVSVSEAGLKIYYIRHAQGGHNVVKEYENVPKDQWPAYVGNPNVFTPKGETQVVAATEKLKKLHFDFIAVSPMWRTRHTILPYLESVGAKAEIWPELREVSSASLILATNLPAPSGRILNAGPHIELPAEEAAYFQFLQDETNECALRPVADKAEHNADIRFALQSAVDRIRTRFGGTEKTILLAGHGTHGKAFLKLLTNDELADTPGIENTGIWMVEEQPDGHFKLEIFNDAPYQKSAAKPHHSAAAKAEPHGDN